MRKEFGLAVALGAALLATACGQQSETVMPKQSSLIGGDTTATAEATPAAPAAAPAETAAAPGNTTAAAAPAAAAPTDPTAKLIAELPAPYNMGNWKNGKVQFSKCLSCHTAVSGGANLTGPHLFGIFGRKSASVADFMYSDPMKAYNVVWDAAKIDHWIENPGKVLPGSKMIFVGIKDAQARRDVIAYLKVASSGGPN